MQDTVFKYTQKQVRTTIINGEPFFRLSDISDILGLSNAYRQVKKFEKGVHTMHVLTNGGEQSVIYVSEPNLYELIFTSKKKEAKLFKCWVFEEVLPKIRKTGEYSIAKELSDESVENRKTLTSSWKSCGIEKPYEYINLTLEEYNSLGFGKGKRKRDFTRSEILALSALEAMEAYKLFNSDINGFLECRASIADTATKLLRIK